MRMGRAFHCEIDHHVWKILKGQKLTCVVRLVVQEPAMAWLVTWPLNTELIELKKLDFPAPTGPMSKTRTWDKDRTVGL